MSVLDDDDGIGRGAEVVLVTGPVDLVGGVAGAAADGITGGGADGAGSVEVVG